ncbi:uncharacterized protein MELLADRAFT_60003 [Melampsora larici-populina 98AG31]|uniref:Uncharacterized protein n=1 Tax=Melampsora larici-populina (strain 98AG31 / pathotype 3-4-7) TaxID=747676 RepID=F4R9L7_MELLP|nr:uncharacterized protein MELLADRAFT_60003 [Melampsora larici-populina 98AG31]EGG11001.1 hypothetical protein MELLADRAFT_60003 [Melampsora larici-populina 98AG31]
MAQANYTPNAGHAQLLRDLQSLQSRLDKVMTGPNTPRAITSEIQQTLSKEAFIFVILGLDYSEENTSELVDQGTTRNSDLVNRLRSIPEIRNLDLSAISRLPPPGSPASRAILLWSHLLTMYSQVFQAQPNSTQDQSPQCAHCLEKIPIGKRYIQFPCHVSSKFHETCFTEMAGFTLAVKCPVCHTIPFVPSQ